MIPSIKASKWFHKHLFRKELFPKRTRGKFPITSSIVIFKLIYVKFVTLFHTYWKIEISGKTGLVLPRPVFYFTNGAQIIDREVTCYTRKCNQIGFAHIRSFCRRLRCMWWANWNLFQLAQKRLCPCIFLYWKNKTVSKILEIPM